MKVEVKEEPDPTDCMIEKIDYTKKLPDFRLVPVNVIKDELTRNGIRVCVKKCELMSMIILVWKYRKQGEIPLKYYFEDSDDEQAQQLNYLEMPQVQAENIKKARAKKKKRVP
jgi:hypothetical protein